MPASAKRLFVVTELPRSAGLGTSSPAEQFVWTVDERSMPRGSWEWELQQRTSREDYGDEPVEHVLGPSFAGTTIAGIWDDRYMGAGAAADTMQRFEALVARGNLVEVRFEALKMIGLIHAVKLQYHRKDLIGYSFTLSPHRRDRGVGVARAARRRVTPAGIRAPDEYRRTLSDRAAEAQKVQTQIRLDYLRGTAFRDMGVPVNDLTLQAASVQAALQLRATGQVPAADADLRVASAFSVMASSGRALKTQGFALKSDSVVAAQTPLAILSFEVWSRSLARVGRQVFYEATRAANETQLRASPRAQTTYQAYAGESLRDIARALTGSEANWWAIAQANDLRTFVVAEPLLLVIPESV